jgi:hypothetical protein
VKVPHAAVKETFLKMGMPVWQAEGIIELSEAMAQGKYGKTTDVVRRLTGHTPKTLEQFLQENVGAFK